MIKRFCDICGDELTNVNTPKDLTGRIKTKLSGKDAELGVEVIVYKDGTSNTGDFCTYCILRAVNLADDRAVQEKERRPPGGCGGETMSGVLRYNFDRVGYAEGISVHASSMEEAKVKAEKLNDGKRLVSRDNQPCHKILNCRFCNLAAVEEK